MKRTLMAALVVTLAACGGGEGSDPTVTTGVVDTTSAGPATTVPPTGSSTTPAQGDEPMDGLTPAESDIVTAAIDDLVGRLDVEPASITLADFERVTWSDGSLGCPQPGMMYTQALVEGSRTILEAGGVTFAYHAGRDDDPFLCEKPSKPSLGPGATLTTPSDES